MTKNEQTKEIRVFFSGRVQGVGFRYTTQKIAQKLNLTGLVRNLPDGRVEVIAEGQQESLEQMVVELSNYFEGYIRDKEAVYHQAKGQFKGFQISY